MRPRPASFASAVLIAAAAFAHLSASRAPADPASPSPERRVPATRDSLGMDALRLGRAAMEQSLGNLQGVVENLEAIDFSTPPAFPEADRAAFLLGQAYLRLGSVDRFASLARSVGGWGRTSAYTQWLAYQLLLVETEAPQADRRAPAPDSAEAGASPAPADSFAPVPNPSASASALQPVGLAAADALAASLLLRQGDAPGALRLLASAESQGSPAPVLVYLKAVALEATGADAEAEWVRLASADTASALGRDLAGAACLRRATRALRRGEDPRPILETVPAGCRYASRARHIHGLASLERGDVEQGRRTLAALLADDSTYVGRREVTMALAGSSLDADQWNAATESYDGVEQDWSRQRDALEQLLTGGSYGALWSAWQSNSPLSDALVVDVLPAQMLAGHFADASADLATRPAMDVLPFETPAPTPQLPWPVPPPPADDWQAIARSARALGEATSELERTRWAMDHALDRLAQRQRYLAIGQVRLQREETALRGHVALLDSVRAMLEAIDRELQSVRDQSKERIARRAAEIMAACDNDRLWLGAMRHFYIDGPNRERAVAPPAGFPSAEELTFREDSLVQEARAFAQRMAADAPDLIDRSYQTAWRPGLIDRVGSLGAEAQRSLAWAQRLGTALDSCLAAARSDERLRILAARIEALNRSSDSLRAAHEALRADVARRAVERALADLAVEREAIDYGLAASAYGMSVHLNRTQPSDSASVDAGPIVVAGDEATPGDTLHTAFNPKADEGEPDDPETAAWRGRAIDRMRQFLERYPQSTARGEMRFRLADLLLVDQRVTFRERMGRYLRDQADGGAAGLSLPVMDPGPALELYRKILAEDRDFEHLDAVLFNAGTLLADDGNPEAAQFFQQLVTTYPDSRYVQEAYLRMGDLEFNQRRFAECVPYYEHASTGGDAGLQAIALYKLGWAHFNQEHFLEAADAFRAVLDVYESGRQMALNVDIRGEAESYLIHTLARAGGASAFAGYFDRIGTRPYEMRVLMAMGQHFRHYSLFGEATAVDSVAIRRYPLAPDALVSAQRLVETYQRWDHSELSRLARLDCAPRFAPRSAWFEAQASDSTRTAGAQFARACWSSVAVYHHLEARKLDHPEDWRQALTLYETLLSYWPSDPESPSFDLYAGEASAKLREYPRALTHYGGAAASGADSVARQALFQRVAVTDAWYESTRGASGALGRDSLAEAVLAAGDEMIQRFPDHDQADDVSWRQANLALAHGWNERATQDLDRMVKLYPNDPRTPMAAGLRGDALFKLGDFERAGEAFEAALAAARRADNDSLERRAELAIPVCYYRHAESVAVGDSTHPERYAELFQKVATRWPRYEHAHLAQYRAGLAYLKAGMPRVAVRAMQALIDTFPKSEFVKDAHLQIAKTWDAAGEKEKAGDAYKKFANRYPDDSSAGDAWLKAADLYTAAGRDDQAEEVWLTYIRKFPDDLETAMEILETLSRRELAAVGPDRPVSSLLSVAPVKKGANAPTSHLADYLERAAAHPELASRDLLAQVRFLQGEEGRAGYEAARLSQPLEKSIPAKQKLLDKLISQYKQSVDLGVSQWASASAFRIGQALVGFGEALEHSERPADLSGDDLGAYEDVLIQQSQPFYDRGESVWAELLKQKRSEESPDTWVQQARAALWKQLGRRFAFRPEVEFPLVGDTPADPKDHDSPRPAKEASSRTGGGSQDDMAHREGSKR